MLNVSMFKCFENKKLQFNWLKSCVFVVSESSPLKLLIIPAIVHYSLFLVTFSVCSSGSCSSMLPLVWWRFLRDAVGVCRSLTSCCDLKVFVGGGGAGLKGKYRVERFPIICCSRFLGCVWVGGDFQTGFFILFYHKTSKLCRQVAGRTSSKEPWL